jgi:preprotein translocase subunit SecB
MNINYKIILNYIKDISLEIPDADALIVSRENISKYLTDIQISSKVMKNNTMEIDTKMIFYDKTKNKKKSHFEIIYSTIIKIEDDKPAEKDLKKLILNDLQIEIFPQIKQISENILKMSGFPKVELKNIDFNKKKKKKLS